MMEEANRQLTSQKSKQHENTVSARSDYQQYRITAITSRDRDTHQNMDIYEYVTSEINLDSVTGTHCDRSRSNVVHINSGVDSLDRNN